MISTIRFPTWAHAFALGAVTYQINRRLVLDSGLRFVLTHDAPRSGLFAGLTIGVADLYKPRHARGNQ